MIIGHCTVFASTRPEVLGKVYTLKDGTLHKEVAGNMSAGTFETAAFSSAADLAALLQSVTTSQALSASLSVGADRGSVCTERALSASAGSVARSKRFFALKSAPGFLLLDYDAPKDGKRLSAQELFSLLCDLVPDAAQAGVIAYPSGSSLIFEGDKQHRGIAGLHLYLMVADASDTQRCGQALSKRLWLAGHGRVEVSASGALLQRTVFDSAVHQEARLCFAGGAVTGPGLEQRRGDPVILSDGGFLDTRKACPDPGADDEARYMGLGLASK